MPYAVDFASFNLTYSFTHSLRYNIWCEGCGNHVGMGVRYNAEKKKVRFLMSSGENRMAL
jgi:hypothetical protein